MSSAAVGRPRPVQPIRTLLAPLLRPRRGALMVMSGAAVAAGFAEAAVLVLIARIAFRHVARSSCRGRPRTIRSDVVLDRDPADVCRSTRRGPCRAAGRVHRARDECDLRRDRADRTGLIHRYLATGWPLQAAQREGRLQELLTTYTDAGANAVGSLTSGMIGAFSLSALLLTALWVSPVASVVAAVLALGLGLMLRPLRAAVRRRSGRTAAADLAFATGLTELTSTLQEVRIFGVEQQVSERLEELNRQSVHAGVRTGYVGDRSESCIRVRHCC